MLTLRPYQKTDTDRILQWIRDERTFHQWCADRFGHYPISADEFNEQYAEWSAENEFHPLTAIDEEVHIVGHLFIRRIASEQRIFRFGFVIVDDTRRGQHIGTEMLRLALQYAIEDLNADKITLGVFENNPSAYRCYRSLGFQKAEIDAVHYVHLLGEDWKCWELEYASIE